MAHETTARFRLSPQQRRVWALQAREARPVYNATCVLALQGALDADALRRAVEAVAEGHEVLRTVFRALPGTRVPLQGIVDGLPPAWKVMEEGEAATAGALVEMLDGAPVSFEDGPLFQAVLAPAGEGRHLLALRVHALCADAAAMQVLAREVAEAYAALAAGGEAAAPEIQYADVSEVFNDLLESEETQAGRDYWARVERSGAEDFALPHAVREGDGFAPRAVEREVDGAVAARVRELAAELDAAPSAVLLAAWQLLLARLAGAGEVEAGVAFDGRVYEGLDAAPGAFVRYLPVRLAVGGGATFRGLAAAVGGVLAERWEWQDYLDPSREGAEGPEHFAFGFDWEERPGPREAAGVRFSLVELRARSERFALRLTGVAEGGGLRLAIEHDAHTVTAREAERTADRLLALLDDATERPDAPAAELTLLPDAELRFVLALGRSLVDAPADRCLHDLFAEAAARAPERPAVVAEGRSLTFAELDALSGRLANLLRGLGVRPESRVGLCMERSPEMLAGLLGILRAGGAVVALDPMYPEERLAYMAGEAGIEVFVTQAAVRERGLLPPGRAVCMDADRERIAAMPASPPDAGTLPDNAAYVIYTSGSTGHPKGVVVQHGSAVNLVHALDEAVYRGRGGLRVSLNAPLVFDGSVKQWVQLCRGHTLHVTPEAERMSPERMLAWIRASELDVLDCTPTLLKGLLAAGLGDGPGHVPGTILSGGEALDPATWARLLALPDTETFNVYGPTECTVDATAGSVREHPHAPSVGHPLPGTRVAIVDAGLRPVPFGVAGEVCLAGPRVARGYLGDPARTAEKFVPDPFGGVPGARMYRTGDLARFGADGAVEFVGRDDDQVKVRGVRIELGEVESVLCAHPRVADAVASVFEAEGEAQLVAYFVARQDGSRDGDADALQGELRDHLRRSLPEFMVPAMVVPLPEVPRTRSGKADRRALPDPRELQRRRRAAYVAPVGETESAIASIWQEVLGVERVGMHDNFFDLGGNSLLVVQAYDRITEALGDRLTLVELFQYPTVTLLAERLSAGREEAAASLSQAETRALKQREAMQRQRRPAAGPRG
ncbi:MAG: amino acid adenylation domain-containing protein [Gemmatimonadota bacterium]